MSFNFNGAQANVSITGSITASPTLPAPTASQTPVNALITLNAGSQTIYTVTAGKTFYLMGIGIGPSANAYVDIYNTANNAQIAEIRALANTTATLTGTTPIYAYPAGTAIKVQGTNAQLCYIWGIEQ